MPCCSTHGCTTLVQVAITKKIHVLAPAVLALTLLSPAVAQAEPAAQCFNANAKLTVEEQRLTSTMPAGGPAVGPTLVSQAGFDPLVGDLTTKLCATKSTSAARQLVTAAGDNLWQTAVDRAQGRRPGMGTLDPHDDRPLYWARLQMSKALRQWQPRFALSAADRTALLTALDHGSRGLNSDKLPTGGGVKKIMVSGFDPFELDGTGVRISNPAGASALQLDGLTISTPTGPAVVQAVTFPVVWGYFDQGIVEAAYGTAIQDTARRPDMIMTISQGRPDQFDIERWAGGWRGGFPDNNNVGATGPVPAAAGWPQPTDSFIETTLPYQQMQATPTGSYKVNFDLLFCVWSDSSHPGTGQQVCRTDQPKPGEVAAQGGGGDYLSNESMYRSNRVRIGLGATAVRGGHLHTPVLGEPAGSTALTDAVFEARRTAIADQTVALVTAAVSGLS
ncbi:secreted protein [Kutzneria sp. 744]|nr:secreted protein [Kutzneria sp. 744]